MQSDTISWFDYPFSSGDLILAAAILLVLAAFLLIFSSRRKITLQHSEVTEEMTIYLSRIAEALEVQSSRTPERVLAEMAAAIKQQNEAPQPSPVPPPANSPRPVRFPVFNPDLPPER